LYSHLQDSWHLCGWKFVKRWKDRY